MGSVRAAKCGYCELRAQTKHATHISRQFANVAMRVSNTAVKNNWSHLAQLDSAGIKHFKLRSPPFRADPCM